VRRQQLCGPGDEWDAAISWTCAIRQAQDAKKELDRHERYWQEQAGEAAKEKWY